VNLERQKKVAKALKSVVLAKSGSLAYYYLEERLRFLALYAQQMNLQPEDLQGRDGLAALAAIAQAKLRSTSHGGLAPNVNAEWDFIVRLAMRHEIHPSMRSAQKGKT
jgi:hypothetical protein